METPSTEKTKWRKVNSPVHVVNLYLSQQGITDQIEKEKLVVTFCYYVAQGTTFLYRDCCSVIRKDRETWNKFKKYINDTRNKTVI